MSHARDKVDKAPPSFTSQFFSRGGGGELPFIDAEIKHGSQIDKSIILYELSYMYSRKCAHTRLTWYRQRNSLFCQPSDPSFEENWLKNRSQSGLSRKRRKCGCLLRTSIALLHSESCISELPLKEGSYAMRTCSCFNS